MGWVASRRRRRAGTRCRASAPGRARAPARGREPRRSRQRRRAPASGPPWLRLVGCGFGVVFRLRDRLGCGFGVGFRLRCSLGRRRRPGLRLRLSSGSGFALRLRSGFGFRLRPRLGRRRRLGRRLRLRLSSGSRFGLQLRCGCGLGFPLLAVVERRARVVPRGVGAAGGRGLGGGRWLRRGCGRRLRGLVRGRRLRSGLARGTLTHAARPPRGRRCLRRLVRGYRLRSGLARGTLARAARPPHGTCTRSLGSRLRGVRGCRVGSGLARRALPRRACPARRAVGGGARGGHCPRGAGLAGRGRRELALERAPVVRVRYARRQHLAALGAAVFRLPRLLRAGPCLRDPGREDEVLAERMAFEVLREQQRDEVRVAGEDDAEHLVGLALVPGRAGEDLHGGRENGSLVRHRRTQQQPADPAVLQRDDMGADAEPGARFVDRAQPVEVGALQRVAGGLERGGPGAGGHVDREEFVRQLGGGLRAEDLRDGVGKTVVGAHRSPPGAGGGVTRPLLSSPAEGRVA